MTPAEYKKLTQPSEHFIQTQIINYLKANNYFCMRLNSGKYSVGEGRSRRFIMGQDAGTPDLFALKDGQSYFLEVKKNKKMHPSPIQVEKMRQIESYGAVCHVLTSLEDCKEYGL